MIYKFKITSKSGQVLQGDKVIASLSKRHPMLGVYLGMLGLKYEDQPLTTEQAGTLEHDFDNAKAFCESCLALLVEHVVYRGVVLCLKCFNEVATRVERATNAVMARFMDGIPLLPGADAIAEERARQYAKGHPAAEDDQRVHGELACVAAVLALPADQIDDAEFVRRFWPKIWPDPPRATHPLDRMRELARAGAFIAAEFDRIYRRTCGTANP